MALGGNSVIILVRHWCPDDIRIGDIVLILLNMPFIMADALTTETEEWVGEEVGGRPLKWWAVGG